MLKEPKKSSRMAITRVNRSSLADDLSNQLIKLIRSGVYQPGDRLPAIMEMARDFGVGHPTVREALSRLEAVGLIDIRHGSGVYVRKTRESVLLYNPVFRGPVSKKLLLDLVEARTPIEVKTVELAARNATEAHLSAMARHLADAEEAADDRDRVNKANIAFHTEIAAASGNAVLHQLQGILSGMFQSEQRVLIEIYGDTERDHAEHLAILDALRRRHAILSVARMEEHLEGVRDVLLRWDPDRRPVE
jgi:GntR family transcriptional repressor for pyruvate dehydrogenase complex